MLRFWLLFIALFSFSLAVEDVNTTSTSSEAQLQKIKEEKLQKQREIDELSNSLSINSVLLEDYGIWLKSYSNHLTYVKVRDELLKIEKKIRKYSKKYQNSKTKEMLNSLRKKETTLEEQLALLSSYGDSAFAGMRHPEEITEVPSVNNPLDIFRALSYVKELQQQLDSYIKKVHELESLYELIQERHKILSELFVKTEDSKYTLMIKEIKVQEEAISNELATFKSTAEVYTQRIDATILSVNKNVEKQSRGIFDLLVIIGILFVVALLIKMIIKRYITDNERYYMANKVINFINFTLVVIIVTFTYMGNVDNIVTVLGFVSAGIAIAMKDWFMSLMGWVVIMIGGSIHVGDRIRVEKDGMIYVGDILDISLLRITLHEDITLTTYMDNRRAGRIIFIPNNYIFTSMIANYSHSTLKTVWDGIDVTITFDSNSKKAIYIAKEITRKYSKGYTDMTRKQLNKLRDRYSLKSTNVEPRIFSFIEPNGIRISIWYLTNSFATLTLRSTISTELVEAYNVEDDIVIAYPTQTMRMHTVEDSISPVDLIKSEVNHK